MMLHSRGPMRLLMLDPPKLPRPRSLCPGLRVELRLAGSAQPRRAICAGRHADAPARRGQEQVMLYCNIA